MKDLRLSGRAITVDWKQWLADRVELQQWRSSDSKHHITVVVSTDLPIDHAELETLVTVDKLVIDVASFTDGRVFGLGRLFRQKLEFTGSIEVKGDYLPDQVSFMKRCGIDSFAGAGAETASEYYSGFYQHPNTLEKHTDIRGARMKYDVY